MKVIIYKPTQNRKTQEIIQSIGNHSNSINIVFTDNLCMLGSQTANRIVKQVDGEINQYEDKTTISVHCESIDIEGYSRKDIDTHIYGLIVTKGIRNIITLTNSIRLPQIQKLIGRLIEPDSLGRAGIVPGNLVSINLYFDEADKHIHSIMDELGDQIDDNEFVKDYYITATPKRVLKIYEEMELYPVENNLNNYISLQHANWIIIDEEGYLPSIRTMLDRILVNNGNKIPSNKFIFAPGINLKDSHFDIAKDSTYYYNIISVVVNSDGLIIYLPLSLDSKYMSTIQNGSRHFIPIIPEPLKTSFNKKYFNSIHCTEDSMSYFKLVFNKKQLIYDNENEFWKIMKVIRNFWTDNAILVTGSRCVERGITIQDPSDNNLHFTDGTLHSDISKSDSGSQMAGRFTLTYNSDKTKADFVPINIYSSEKTKIYMINQEKKAMYGVELASEGKRKINYKEWRNYERRSILGLKSFKTFYEAILFANDTMKGVRFNIKNKERYDERNPKLGSCNLIEDQKDENYGFRFNSFDMSGKDIVKRPINEKEFEIRCTRHLSWTTSTYPPWRIWSVYTDIKDKSTLKYNLCWTPVALLGEDGNESDTDSDSDL